MTSKNIRIAIGLAVATAVLLAAVLWRALWYGDAAPATSGSGSHIQDMPGV